MFLSSHQTATAASAEFGALEPSSLRCGVAIVPMTAMPVATAIVNTFTGRRGADDVEAILREVLAPHMKLTILRTRPRGGCDRARPRGGADSDIVIAVGGDGTVSEVAAGHTRNGLRSRLFPTARPTWFPRNFNIPSEPVGPTRILIGTLEIGPSTR